MVLCGCDTIGTNGLVWRVVPTFRVDSARFSLWALGYPETPSFQHLLLPQPARWGICERVHVYLPLGAQSLCGAHGWS